MAKAKEEALAIGELMNGRSVTDQKATKTEFVNVGSQADIIHLATHKIVDDRDSMKSRFAFTGGDNLDEQLLA